MRIINIKLPIGYSHGEHAFFKYGKNELVYATKSVGKAIKDKDLICILQKGVVSGIFFQKKVAHPRIHINISYKEFSRFVKTVEKRHKKLGSCWNHISPDLSFFITK
jgi:hypothetical protein